MIVVRSRWEKKKLKVEILVGELGVKCKDSCNDEVEESVKGDKKLCKWEKGKLRENVGDDEEFCNGDVEIISGDLKGVGDDKWNNKSEKKVL